MSNRSVRGDGSSSPGDPPRGIAELNRACQERFPGSRACTTRDFALTFDPAELTAEAWIRPVPIAIGLTQDGAGFHRWIMDAVSEHSVDLHNDDNTLNCFGWSRLGKTGVNYAGLSVAPPSGVFERPNCETLLRVACCSCEE